MTSPVPNAPPVLELRGITKRFPGVVANDNVSLTLSAGEVLALLGENGAGKSTVISVMYGLYRPDEGEILVNGQPVTIGSPAQALKLGIGLVPQHPMLVSKHTVAENLALGGSGFFPARTIAGRIRELSQKYGLGVDPSAKVWQLSPGEKQRVEILRSLLRGVRVLILDEPTSVLTPQEVEGLFKVMNELRADGKSLIFISHKLGEVLDITDRVTVLRKGKVTGNAPTSGATRESLAEMMVGRSVSFERKRETPPELGSAPVRFSARNLQALSSRGLPALRGVNLDLRRGEIIGVAGVAGNGQSELVEVLAGLHPLQGGTVTLDGAALGHDARAIFESGVAHIPEDRIHMGTVPSMSVAENLALREYAKAPLSRGPVRDLGALDAHAREMVRAFDISTPGVDTPSRLLSGGNIQKVILARELGDLSGQGGAKVILAVHPTYGLDIGATEQVHRTLMDAAGRGAGVLLVSEDLDELLALSDRIAVMYHGELLGPYDAASATREGIGLIMAGGEVAQNGGVPHGAGPGDLTENAGPDEPNHTKGLRA